MIKIAYLIIATTLSAFCYRVGGMSKEEAKSHFPTFPQFLVRSWFRDFNCTLLTILYVLLFLPHISWWWYLLAFGSQYAATTTYHDTRFYNWDKPNDNFFLHGLFIRLSLMFIAIPLGLGLSCLISMVVLSLFMGIWCTVFSSAFVEEYGRGSVIIFTLPII